MCILHSNNIYIFIILKHICTLDSFINSTNIILLTLLQLEEDRLMTIQHHNHQLLTRMNQIMHTTGRVDHRNLDWKPKRRYVTYKTRNEHYIMLHL